MRHLRSALHAFKPQRATSQTKASTINEKSQKECRQRVLTFSSLLSVVAATVLIDSLIITMAAATIWATGGYLHLSLVPFSALVLAGAGLTIWACVSVAFLAFDAETDPLNNTPLAPRRYPPTPKVEHVRPTD